jgi:uncharacterized protein YqhQ
MHVVTLTSNVNISCSYSNNAKCWSYINIRFQVNIGHSSVLFKNFVVTCMPIYVGSMFGVKLFAPLNNNIKLFLLEIVVKFFLSMMILFIVHFQLRLHNIRSSSLKL